MKSGYRTRIGLALSLAALLLVAWGCKYDATQTATTETVMTQTVGGQGAVTQATPDDVKSLFEARYQALQQYSTSGEAGARDPLLTAQGWTLYLKIKELGPPALPYIIEKIEEGDWRMGGCVSMITEKRFNRSDYADVRYYGDSITKAGMYVDWWHQGRKDTPQQFETLYQEWKDLANQGQQEAAADKYRLIRRLGIAALPYMIKKVEQGDADLIPLVSRLTSGASGAPDAISSTASAAECVDWWNKNKQAWTLPPVESETVSSTP